ncbi:hypothetical protein H632_c72p2 [Helicosporidium sp. ATCC 50920]|nr:hypothetical protein H632_c72p2 [Helicosporidium sp. ATCC 50920]|eukprot:KDD76901.1 hypothetical protein H632_c72p2 [Helicosporidium sp. ATCC 50920]
MSDKSVAAGGWAVSDAAAAPGQPTVATSATDRSISREGPPDAFGPCSKPPLPALASASELGLAPPSPAPPAQSLDASAATLTPFAAPARPSSHLGGLVTPPSQALAPRGLAPETAPSSCDSVAPPSLSDGASDASPRAQCSLPPRALGLAPHVASRVIRAASASVLVVADPDSDGEGWASEDGSAPGGVEQRISKITLGHHVHLSKIKRQMGDVSGPPGDLLSLMARKVFTSRQSSLAGSRPESASSPSGSAYLHAQPEREGQAPGRGSNAGRASHESGSEPASEESGAGTPSAEDLVLASARLPRIRTKVPRIVSIGG